MRRSTRLTPILICAALAAGCTASPGPDAPDTAESTPKASATFTEIAVPADAHPEGDVIHEATPIAATDTLPGLLVARVTSPGQASRLGLWTVKNATPTPADLNIDGVTTIVEEVHAAGSDDLVAIAAHTSDGVTRPLLATSTDRLTWSKRSLPAQTDNVTFTALTVNQADVLAVGADSDDQPVLLHLAGDQANVVKLPLATGKSANVSGVAVAGGQVVVIATISATDGPSEGAYAWSSTDGGATFTDPVALSSRKGAAPAGIVRTADTWLVTGTRTDKKDDTIPAAWTSPDAAAWDEENPRVTMEGSDWKPWGEGRDATVGQPVLTDSGAVWVPFGHTGGVWTGMYVRNPAGKWSLTYDRTSDKALGWEVTTRIALEPDGSVTAARTTRGGWAGLSKVTANGWRPVETLASGTRELELWGARTQVDGSLVVDLPRSQIVPTEDGVEAKWAGSHVVVRDGKAEFASDEDGSTVMLSHAENPDTGEIVALGMTAERTSLATRWKKKASDVKGRVVKQDGNNLRGIEFIDGQWIAHIQDDETHHLITSSDGKKWKSAPTKVTKDINFLVACTLPAGGALVAGSVESDDQQHPAAATLVGKDWKRTELPDTEAGRITSCLTTPTEVLVTLARPDDTTDIWSTTDGVTFTAYSEHVEGTLKGLTAIPGGFAATGYVASAGHHDVVLWVSNDAQTWSWAPVPAAGLGEASLRLVGHGDGALLSILSTGGLRLWQVTDIAPAS